MSQWLLVNVTIHSRQLGVFRMMRRNRRRGRQTHVPRVLLQNFAIDRGTSRGRVQIWTFDKANDALYRSNIGHIATQASIQEGAVDAKKWNIDPGLGTREDQIKSVLTKLSTAKALNVLTSEERAWFSIFCAAQVVRVAELRNRTEQMIDAVVLLRPHFPLLRNSSTERPPGFRKESCGWRGRR